jgi:hypothetical protein
LQWWTFQDLLNLFGRTVLDDAVERRQVDGGVELVKRVHHNVWEEYLCKEELQFFSQILEACVSQQQVNVAGACFVKMDLVPGRGEGREEAWLVIQGHIARGSAERELEHEKKAFAIFLQGRLGN